MNSRNSCRPINDSLATAVNLAATIDADTYSEVIDFVEELGIHFASWSNVFTRFLREKIEKAAAAANCTPQMMGYLLLAAANNYFDRE